MAVCDGGKQLSITIIGPERPDPVLPQLLKRDGIRGPVALISAGWRQDEARDEPLRAALGVTVHNLGVYRAFQEVERHAPELARAYTKKQAELQKLRQGYHDAIVAGLAGCMKLYSNKRDLECPWFKQAVAHLRDVDALWLAEADRLHQGFEEEVHPFRHRLVRAEIARIADILRGCEAVLIAGGHVGVLRNRMFFFGLDRILRNQRIYAWSGGAMVLCDRILLYHDFTPYGVGTAEVLDRGMGLVPGLWLLAHARQRLNMANHDALAVMVARLGPQRVIGLENGAILEGSNCESRGRAESAFEFQKDGSVRDLGSGDAART
ncbi:MAG TPA: hypothetical protein PKW90_12315 [Myxococcota bacterium]|nr:hypothetical protein [Myxococcota bacterium]